MHSYSASKTSFYVTWNVITNEPSQSQYAPWVWTNDSCYRLACTRRLSALSSISWRIDTLPVLLDRSSSRRIVARSISWAILTTLNAKADLSRYHFIHGALLYNDFSIRNVSAFLAAMRRAVLWEFRSLGSGRTVWLRILSISFRIILRVAGGWEGAVGVVSLVELMVSSLLCELFSILISYGVDGERVRSVNREQKIPVASEWKVDTLKWLVPKISFGCKFTTFSAVYSCVLLHTISW